MLMEPSRYSDSCPHLSSTAAKPGMKAIILEDGEFAKVGLAVDALLQLSGAQRSLL